MVDGLSVWLPIWPHAHRHIDILLPALTNTGPASCLARPRFGTTMSSYLLTSFAYLLKSTR